MELVWTNFITFTEVYEFSFQLKYSPVWKCLNDYIYLDVISPVCIDGFIRSKSIFLVGGVERESQQGALESQKKIVIIPSTLILSLCKVSLKIRQK
jgi:hypothetical protein